MNLADALELSENGKAVSTMRPRDNPIGPGYLYAMWTNDGDPFVACTVTGHMELRPMRQLSTLSPEMRAYYEDADWRPHKPKAPLEALADQAEEYQYVTGSDST